MIPKRAGCCTKCDAEVFEVVKRDPETRVPVLLGAAKDEAVRATFLLANGSLMDLTFCASCMETLTPADYAAAWKRVMASWIEESGANHSFVKRQHANAIMGLYSTRPWKEVH